MTEDRFIFLLNGWLAQDLSQPEIDVFLDEINRGTYQHILDARLDNDFIHSGLEAATSNSKKQALLDQLLALTEKDKKAKLISFGRIRRAWIGWGAAAVLAGVMVFVALHPFITKQRSNEPSASDAPKIDYPANSVAVITLPDQSRIRVDTISGTIVLDQYGIKITKLPSGEIVYTHTGNRPSAETAQAMVANPRGSKPLALRLSDHTVVWLNAESSLQYPLVFDTNSREVRLSGEGYFEVARDPAKKFRVHTDQLTTEVLGTHFNIRSYNNEPHTSVTLLEGSVNVRENRTSNQVTLKPNQQARLEAGLRVLPVSNAADVVAWKAGLLIFTDADLTTILEEIRRSYDVELRFNGPVSAKQYSGTINKNTSLAEVLHIISTITGVQCRQQGKTIVVTQ